MQACDQSFYSSQDSARKISQSRKLAIKVQSPKPCHFIHHFMFRYTGFHLRGRGGAGEASPPDGSTSPKLPHIMQYFFPHIIRHIILMVPPPPVNFPSKQKFLDETTYTFIKMISIVNYTILDPLSFPVRGVVNISAQTLVCISRHLSHLSFFN